MQRNIDLGNVKGDKGDSRFVDGYGSGSASTEYSTAGCMGFKFFSTTQMGPDDKIIDLTVNNVGQAEVGDRISCKATYSWNFFGAITAITGKVITVEAVLKKGLWPPNFNPFSGANNYFWIPDKPDAGNSPIGVGAFSIGQYNKANELGALAIGSYNIADGRGSFAGGKDNEVGYASMAFGVDNTVDATMSCALGYQNTVKGYHSLVNGQSNTASGQNSHAEGIRSVASGNESHAEGGATQATGSYSHSEGENTVAANRGSHAEGFKTITNADYQHVEGQYNYPNAAFAFIIGRGTSENARKNIFGVSTGGGLALKGNVYVEANDNSTGGKKLATEEYARSGHRYDVEIKSKTSASEVLTIRFCVYRKTAWSPTSLSDVVSALSAAGFTSASMTASGGCYDSGVVAVINGISASGSDLVYEGIGSDGDFFGGYIGSSSFSDYTVTAQESSMFFE